MFMGIIHMCQFSTLARHLTDYVLVSVLILFDADGVGSLECGRRLSACTGMLRSLSKMWSRRVRVRGCCGLFLACV